MNAMLTLDGAKKCVATLTPGSAVTSATTAVCQLLEAPLRQASAGWRPEPVTNPTTGAPSTRTAMEEYMVAMASPWPPTRSPADHAYVVGPPSAADAWPCATLRTELNRVWYAMCKVSVPSMTGEGGIDTNGFMASPSAMHTGASVQLSTTGSLALVKEHVAQCRRKSDEKYATPTRVSDSGVATENDTLVGAEDTRRGMSQACTA